MPSLKGWVQRQSGLIKSEEKREQFNLKVSRELGIEAVISNQSKLLLCTESYTLLTMLSLVVIQSMGFRSDGMRLLGFQLLCQKNLVLPSRVRLIE